MYPPLPNLNDRRTSVKFSKGATGSRYPRVFWFDTSVRKLKYLHSPQSTKDQESKAKNLSECEYEITNKGEPGEYKWDDASKEVKYRLTMNFKKRPTGPIFFYSNNLSEILILKGYGLYCKRMASEESASLESKASKLLDSLWYNSASVGFNLINRLYRNSVGRSGKIYKSIKCIGDANTYLEDQKKTLLKAWANNVNSKAKHFKPKSTIRLALFLRSLARIHNPDEETICRSTKKILDAYKEEHKVTERVFDDAINEKTNRRFKGMPACSVYEVSPLIKEYAKNPKEIPSEHESYTKFDFPTNQFEIPDSQVRIDYDKYKMNIVSRYDENRIYGSVPIDDISSIVLNEAPPRMINEDLLWLKVNGRRIREKEEPGKFDNNEIEGAGFSEEYIDPASKFYALSIDSYLTKKTLIELKLHSVRIKDASQAKKDLNTEQLKLRLKINIGGIFWTSLPFASAKVKGDSISCDFKQICRVRINPDLSDYFFVTLLAVAAESDKLPDSLKTLKKEKKLGSVRIPLEGVAEQKKITWVPLNYGIHYEDTFVSATTPMVAMNMHILKDVTLNSNS